YKRIAALEQLGRDTVDAVMWPMSEAAAVLLDRSLRLSEHETALEVGWLLAELERRFDYGLDELARRFDRSVSWVSRRLALAEILPEAIQQQVREGKILAQVAMKFLVPVARQSLEDCQRMAAIFAEHHCDTREAGQLYGAWRKGSPAIRKRILDDPELFFKTHRDSGTERETSEQTGDRAGDGGLARGGAQSTALELQRGAGTAPSREGRTSPPTDPGAFRAVQGESRSSP